MKKLMFAIITALLSLAGNLSADTYEGMDPDNRHYYIGQRGGRYYINANGKKTYSARAEIAGDILSDTIYTGSRGGRYYINCNGNKTYIARKKGERSNYSSYKFSSPKRSRSYSYKSSSTKRSRSYSYKSSSAKRSRSYFSGSRSRSFRSR